MLFNVHHVVVIISSFSFFFFFAFVRFGALWDWIYDCFFKGNDTLTHRISNILIFLSHFIYIHTLTIKIKL